jgi:protein transport protein SEC61 subunit gamma-like protein
MSRKESPASPPSDLDDESMPSSAATSPAGSEEKSPLLGTLRAPTAPAGLLTVPQKFFTDSANILRRCTKPDGKEYTKICQTVFVGFLIMGFLGYFIKLIHIPINNIIVGA